MRNLSDAVVLVVGANGGLGRALCASLSARGARLVLAGRDQDTLKAQYGSDARVVVGEFDDPGFPERAVREASAAFGRLDGVVSAAGIVAFGALSDTTDAVWEQLLAVNLLGPVRLMRAFAAVGDGGFFVSLSGIVAEGPLLGVGAYGASKAAVSLATRTFAAEARRKQITVLDARPPHTETGLATRPIAGNAPRMPQGLQPADVAERIVRAIEAEERELPASAFKPEPAPAP